MLNLAVIFGSRAAEHDVSIISGLQILENADKSKYNAFPVYISRKGEWFVGEPLRKVETYKNFNPEAKGITRVILPPVPGMNGLYILGQGGLFGAKTQKVADVDCALLALHGMHGEDGTIQGLFELANIPYTSCGVTGSAVGMDYHIDLAFIHGNGNLAHDNRGKPQLFADLAVGHMLLPVVEDQRLLFLCHVRPSFPK